MRVAAAAACFAGLAVAVPTQAADSYKWEVKGWTAECVTNVGCSYDFEISGPASAAPAPAKPAFAAKCSGSDPKGPETDYADCALTSGDFAGRVVSRLRTPPALLGALTVAPLEVALIFADPNGQANTYYNTTGYADTFFTKSQGKEPQDFTITPSVTVGVA